jgi:hypothetical protein
MRRAAKFPEGSGLIYLRPTLRDSAAQSRRLRFPSAAGPRFGDFSSSHNCERGEGVFEFLDDAPCTRSLDK